MSTQESHEGAHQRLRSRAEQVMLQAARKRAAAGDRSVWLDLYVPNFPEPVITIIGDYGQADEAHEQQIICKPGVVWPRYHDRSYELIWLPTSSEQQIIRFSPLHDAY